MSIAYMQPAALPGQAQNWNTLEYDYQHQHQHQHTPQPTTAHHTPQPQHAQPYQHQHTYSYDNYHELPRVPPMTPETHAVLPAQIHDGTPGDYQYGKSLPVTPEMNHVAPYQQVYDYGSPYIPQAKFSSPEMGSMEENAHHNYNAQPNYWPAALYQPEDMGAAGAHGMAAPGMNYYYPQDGVLPVPRYPMAPANAAAAALGNSQKDKPRCYEHGCNGRQFSTFSNLLRHQREKSGNSPKSICPRCKATFTRTTARNGHMLMDKCKPAKGDTGVLLGNGGIKKKQQQQQQSQSHKDTPRLTRELSVMSDKLSHSPEMPQLMMSNSLSQSPELGIIQLQQ